MIIYVCSFRLCQRRQSKKQFLKYYFRNCSLIKSINKDKWKCFKKELSVVCLKPTIRLYNLITHRIVIPSSCLKACLMGCCYWELLMSHFEQSVFICIRSFQILLKYSLVALLPSLLCYIWFKWAHRYTTSSNTVLNPLKEIAFLIFEISIKFTTFKTIPCQSIKYIFLSKL